MKNDPLRISALHFITGYVFAAILERIAPQVQSRLHQKPARNVMERSPEARSLKKWKDFLESKLNTE